MRPVDSHLPHRDLPADVTPAEVHTGVNYYMIQNEDMIAPCIPTRRPIAATFTDFINTQPEHVRILLADVTITGSCVFHLCQTQLKDLSKVLLVSDGGAIPRDRGSFGWVLANTDGTRLAKGKGVVPGFDPMSHQSELTGSKAGLWFLLLAHEFTATRMSNKEFNLYSDNASMLKKLGKLKQFRTARHSAVLHSEYDMLAECHNLLDQFPSRPQLHHVKGHQDSGDPDKKLSLEAELNVEADALATEALQQVQAPMLKVPLSQSAAVLLDLDGRTVTRHIESSLKHHIHRPGARACMCDRFQWTCSAFDTIDWEVFNASLRSMKRRQQWCFKFTLKKLPAGERLHRREEHYDHHCPLCGGEQETDDHMLQCPSTTTTEWRKQLLDKVRDATMKHMDPNLITIANLGISSQLLGGNFDPTGVCKQARFDTCMTLIREQQALGWDHFMRGKLSHQWQQRQSIYQMECHPTIKDRPVLKLIKTLWKNIQLLWKERCIARHGDTWSAKHAVQKMSAERELRHYYSQKCNMLPSDQEIFLESVEAHLRRPLQNILNWLAMHRKTLRRSVNQATKRIIKTNHMLTEYITVTKRPKTRRRQTATVTPSPANTSTRKLNSTRMTKFFQHTHNTASRLKTPITTEGSQDDINHSPILQQRTLFPDHPS